MAQQQIAEVAKMDIICSMKNANHVIPIAKHALAQQQIAKVVMMDIIWIQQVNFVFNV